MNSFSKIKAIIFDCDGTLVESESAHYKSWQYALQQQGGDLTEEQYHSYVGNDGEKNARLFAALIGTNNVEQILKDKKTRFSQMQQVGLAPIQSTVDFLHRLEGTPVKLALASAARKEEILFNLRHVGIAHLFDAIISGEDDLRGYHDPEGVNKPKPYIYLQAAKELGLEPSQCIAIEDSAIGVTAAVTAGCFTIAVPNDYTIHQDLSHADMTVASFVDIELNDLIQMTQHLEKIT